VQTVGQPFDPNLHEAVQQVETSEVPAGAIAQELLAGYRLGDRLVRPAMVVVAKPPAS
jgi:molecular chaperone GrpE